MLYCWSLCNLLGRFISICISHLIDTICSNHFHSPNWPLSRLMTKHIQYVLFRKPFTKPHRLACLTDPNNWLRRNLTMAWCEYSKSISIPQLLQCFVEMRPRTITIVRFVRPLCSLCLSMRYWIGSFTVYHFKVKVKRTDHSCLKKGKHKWHWGSWMNIFFSWIIFQEVDYDILKSFASDGEILENRRRVERSLLRKDLLAKRVPKMRLVWRRGRGVRKNCNGTKDRCREISQTRLPRTLNIGRICLLVEHSNPPSLQLRQPYPTTCPFRIPLVCRHVEYHTCAVDWWRGGDETVRTAGQLNRSSTSKHGDDGGSFELLVE